MQADFYQTVKKGKKNREGMGKEAGKKGRRGRRSRFKRGAKVGKEYCKIAKIGNKPR